MCRYIFIHTCEYKYIQQRRAKHIDVHVVTSYVCIRQTHVNTYTHAKIYKHMYTKSNI